MFCDIEILFDDYIFECEELGRAPEFTNARDWWESLE